MDIVRIFGSNLKKYRTALGLSQEALAEKGSTFRLATSAEESVGIDGYVGDTPYSVKPDTYKTMGRLSEAIDVKMIYYTKTKTGLKIEVEE